MRCLNVEARAGNYVRTECADVHLNSFSPVTGSLIHSQVDTDPEQFDDRLLVADVDVDALRGGTLPEELALAACAFARAFSVFLFWYSRPFALHIAHLT